MSTKPLPPNGITIEQAKNWTAAWQTKNPNLSKAFLIPIPGILQLLEELTVLKSDGKGGLIVNDSPTVAPKLRSYLAIGPDEKGVLEEKLVLVGAVKVGTDYQDQVEESPHTLKVSLSGSGVFDFSKPCPKYCDKTSPLNHD